jgi:hypothetical protein
MCDFFTIMYVDCTRKKKCWSYCLLLAFSFVPLTGKQLQLLSVFFLGGGAKVEHNNGVFIVRRCEALSCTRPDRCHKHVSNIVLSQTDHTHMDIWGSIYENSSLFLQVRNWRRWWSLTSYLVNVTEKELVPVDTVLLTKLCLY